MALTQLWKVDNHFPQLCSFATDLLAAIQSFCKLNICHFWNILSFMNRFEEFLICKQVFCSRDIHLCPWSCVSERLCSILLGKCIGSIIWKIMPKSKLIQSSFLQQQHHITKYITLIFVNCFTIVHAFLHYRGEEYDSRWKSNPRTPRDCCVCFIQRSTKVSCQNLSSWWNGKLCLFLYSYTESYLWQAP